MQPVYLSHSMIKKIKSTIKELKGKGFIFAFKKVGSFFLGPLNRFIKRHKFLVELKFGFFQKLKFYIPFHPVKSDMIIFPKTELVERARKFWYGNVPGEFDLEGEKITRKDIFNYGGPDPKFTCPVCQKSEWLSRVRQKDLFISHDCQTSKECKVLCSRQGDESWANIHQNFNFSIGIDKELSAPRCLFIDYNPKRNFLTPHCDNWILTFRRRLAYAFQMNVVNEVVDINWSDYDFLFVINNGNNKRFKRPPLPVIMYGHDSWPLDDKGFQWMIDWLKPNLFMTPDPTLWSKIVKLPLNTSTAFYPLFESEFFIRPNLGEKETNLLVVGGIVSGSFYEPRAILSKQIEKITDKYNIKFSHSVGARHVFKHGPTIRKDEDGGLDIRFLNKWSEFLGTAKYVVFGRMQYQGIAFKHFETLGSGAIPIFPELEDFKYLGIKPFEHYIPLSEIEGNNERLSYFLDHYDEFKHIAKNAVDWYKRVSDKMMFNDFEDAIKEVVGYKFPKRLI